MKTFYLLRHAKSDWGGTGLPDVDRPLNARGRLAAPAIGAAMRLADAIPAVALCSAAKRAVETWTLLGPELNREIPVKTMRSLYLASPNRLLETVRRLPASSPSAILIGHNPGLQSLAIALAGPGSVDQALASLREKYPSGALAEFHFHVDEWSDLRIGTGQLVRFLRPRDLA